MSDFEEFKAMTLFELLKWDFENKEMEEHPPSYSNWIDAIDNIYPFQAIFDRLKTVERDLQKLNRRIDRLVQILGNLGKIEVSLKEWMEAFG